MLGGPSVRWARTRSVWPPTTSLPCCWPSTPPTSDVLRRAHSQWFGFFSPWIVRQQRAPGRPSERLDAGGEKFQWSFSRREWKNIDFSWPRDTKRPTSIVSAYCWIRRANKVGECPLEYVLNVSSNTGQQFWSSISMMMMMMMMMMMAWLVLRWWGERHALWLAFSAHYVPSFGTVATSHRIQDPHRDEYYSTIWRPTKLTELLKQSTSPSLAGLMVDNDNIS